MSFNVRGLELHGRTIWRRDRILEALDFIERHDMTHLVLHETDLMQMVTYPRSYFDPHALWTSAPTRRGENAIENNRIYLDHVLQLAHNRNIGVFIEVKEIGFPDELITAHPELVKQGVICPSEPFWYEFIERKTDEFFEDFPLTAGMITSPGSTEGKTSRAQNKCTCELCARTSVEDWYCKIIAALHRATKRHGKRLVVRDFAYKPEDHEPLIKAVEKSPPEVVFCLKVTPHDFYVTFPDNPGIGRLDREQWIEYDAMGQFYGWGIFPCFVLDDIRSRLDYAGKHGVTGGIFRTEWERINDYWVLESLNETNLIAAAELAKGRSVDPESVARQWLEKKGSAIEAAAWLGGVLARTWPIVKGAVYANDFVFADNSMFPRSVRRAWWSMETLNALHTWAPDREADLTMDRSKVQALIAEKQKALDLARQLAGDVKAGHTALDPDLHTELIELFDRFVLYVEGFLYCGAVCFYSRWVDQERRNDTGPDAGELQDFKDWLARLEAFGQRIRPIATEARYRHQVVMLMDYRRIADVLREGRQALDLVLVPSSDHA